MRGAENWETRREAVIQVQTKKIQCWCAVDFTNERRIAGKCIRGVSLRIFVNEERGAVKLEIERFGEVLDGKKEKMRGEPEFGVHKGSLIRNRALQIREVNAINS